MWMKSSLCLDEELVLLLLRLAYKHLSMWNPMSLHSCSSSGWSGPLESSLQCVQSSGPRLIALFPSHPCSQSSMVLCALKLKVQTP